MADKDSKRAKVPSRPLTADVALRAAAAARDKARELGVPMSVSVVDESANLVYFLRGEECSFVTFETSKGKAAASAGFRRPTAELIGLTRENPVFWQAASKQLGMIIGAGGVPITMDGVLIGAIGCGGASAEQDHLCAEAGAMAVSS
jgi:uncharacterized protein GlcG (DUF336 family)